MNGVLMMGMRMVLFDAVVTVAEQRHKCILRLLALIMVSLLCAFALNGCSCSREPVLSEREPISLPETGIIFQNPNYTGSTITVDIDGSELKTAAILDIYAAPTRYLIATVFIRSGDSFSIDVAGWQGDDSVTSARYFFSMATGEEWYGSSELFGEDGKYLNISADGVPEIWLSGDFTLSLFDTSDSFLEYRELEYVRFLEFR
jgi:hypothetical protein